MSRWPILNTPAEKAGLVRWWHHAIACAAVVVLPTVLGFAVLSVINPDSPLASTVFAEVDGALVGMFAFFSTFSFYFSWLGLLIGVPLAIRALKIGKAGWGAALAVGVLAGALISAFLSMPMAVPMGASLALIYWISLRLLVSDAFSN